MEYYIYRHIRLDTKMPFYIGKGKNKRAWEGSPSRRNSYWNNIAIKYGYKVELIMENLTEKRAFSKEKEFIKLYKDLGHCEANLTIGGEGCSLFGKENPMYGKKHTESTKQKMRTAHLGGNNHFYGKSHTEKTKSHLSAINSTYRHTDAAKLKISKSQTGKRHHLWKGYITTPKGIFESLTEASKTLPISRSAIHSRCTSSKFPNWYFDKTHKGALKWQR